jgi:hypothetical protein
MEFIQVQVLMALGQESQEIRQLIAHLNTLPALRRRNKEYLTTFS